MYVKSRGATESQNAERTVSKQVGQTAYWISLQMDIWILWQGRSLHLTTTEVVIPVSDS